MERQKYSEWDVFDRMEEWINLPAFVETLGINNGIWVFRGVGVF